MPECVSPVKFITVHILEIVISVLLAYPIVYNVAQTIYITVRFVSLAISPLVDHAPRALTVIALSVLAPHPIALIAVQGMDF